MPVIRRPEAIRPWQHVLEPLSGYLVLIERLLENGPKYAGPWNFGPDKESEKPVSQVANRIFNLWNQEPSWSHDETPQPHEAGILKLDCSKARSLLGWRPRWDLDKTLQATTAWYRLYGEGADTLPLLRDQINAYETGA